MGRAFGEHPLEDHDLTFAQLALDALPRGALWEKRLEEHRADTRVWKNRCSPAALVG
jgi:hypothetical protein